MTDTIIKGSGNSRSLKTVPNALTMYPTHEAMIAAMVDGTFPIDLGPLNMAGLNVKGTDLNKASLLTDTLCSALGLSTTATPTEAMEKLRQLIATAQSTANSANTNANGRAKIETVSYVGTNTFGANGPSSITFSFAPQWILSAGRDQPVSVASAWPVEEYRSGFGFGPERSSGGTLMGKKSSNGRTFTWYITVSDPTSQNNYANIKYYYLGIG